MNLVKNGDFTLGLQYWTSDVENSDIKVMTKDSLTFVRLAYNSRVFHQTIDVEPNQMYELTCLARKNTPGLWVHTGGRYASGVATIDLLPGSDFKEYSIKIDTIENTRLDVFMIVEPNEWNTDDMYADWAKVSLVKKE